MAFYPGAENRLLPPGVNHSSGGMGIIHGMVVHVIVGSLAAADSAFHNPAWKASAHFGVDKAGHIVQWVDTHDKAWAEAAGNPNWISVETEGFPDGPLTIQQVQSVAKITRWASDLYKFPLQVTDSPTGFGVGTHSMGGTAWGGHACPGAIRAGQRADIVRLAAPAPPAPAPVPTQTGEDMSYIVQLAGHPHTFVTNGITARWHVNEDDHNRTVWHLAANHQDTTVYTETVEQARVRPLFGPIDPVLIPLGFVKA